MIDLFILLTPLAVLPIALYFVFIGCDLEHPPYPPTSPSSTPTTGVVPIILFRRTVVLSFRNYTDFNVSRVQFNMGIAALPDDVDSRDITGIELTYIHPGLTPIDSFSATRPGNIIEPRYVPYGDGRLETLQFIIHQAIPGRWEVGCSCEVEGGTWPRRLVQSDLDEPRGTTTTTHTIGFVLRGGTAGVEILAEV